jgi:site-specific DNA recombinase
MLGAFAEFERAKIIERTTRGRLHRLRMGEMSSNGHRIYGYHYVKKTRPHRRRSPSMKSRPRWFGRSLRCSRATTAEPGCRPRAAVHGHDARLRPCGWPPAPFVRIVLMELTAYVL